MFVLDAKCVKKHFKISPGALLRLTAVVRLCVVGVMVKSGEVFPANFPDKGPEQPLRLARLFTGLQPVRTYSCNTVSVSTYSFR